MSETFLKVCYFSIVTGITMANGDTEFSDFPLNLRSELMEYTDRAEADIMTYFSGAAGSIQQQYMHVKEMEDSILPECQRIAKRHPEYEDRAMQFVRRELNRIYSVYSPQLAQYIRDSETSLDIEGHIVPPKAEDVLPGKEGLPSEVKQRLDVEVMEAKRAFERYNRTAGTKVPIDAFLRGIVRTITDRAKNVLIGFPEYSEPGKEYVSQNLRSLVDEKFPGMGDKAFKPDDPTDSGLVPLPSEKPEKTEKKEEKPKDTKAKKKSAWSDFLNGLTFGVYNPETGEKEKGE